MTGKARGRKSIFITGGASGMGRATAKLFVEKGWFVGAYDVNASGLATLEQEIGSDNCVTGVLDVTQKQAFDSSIAAFAQETDGKLDLLFSNAGIGESGWFEDIPYDAALRVVQVNLVGVITSIYAALPLLKNTPNSLCFITSSSSATYGMPRIAVYSATKHGVKGLTEALSVEFARHGVRVADVLPGLIDTDILRSTPNRSGDRAQPSDEEFYASAPKTGMFRLMPASAVAESVWAAYRSDRLHWYVPDDIAWIDRIKGFAPRFMRNQIVKRIGTMLGGQQEPSKP
ncbi:MAG: SDR family oxidoreductase [Rhizomicrobium sp.]|jgi:NAD(P)-dependent dehydrogenase (short-subunit alcohol dehydrogenase family)